MTRNYLAVNDAVHELIRGITRRTLLYPRATSPERPPRIVYHVREDELPEAYYSLGMLHSLGGMALDSVPQCRWRVRPEERTGITQQVNFFDIVSLDKRCARDLRLKPKKLGPFMIAAELLVFGTGMLRARNDDPEDPLHRFLWSQHGRIIVPGERIHAHIRALHRYSDHSVSLGKEAFDSTNVIYGDALGELEQLWERRADTAFLEAVAVALHDFRVNAQVAAYMRPPMNLMGVVELHLKRQAVWKVPPADARALLKRIEFILNRTQIQNTPVTAFRYRRSQPRGQLPATEWWRGGPHNHGPGHEPWSDDNGGPAEEQDWGGDEM